MRSLYVSRDLLNPEPLIAWAKLQGFKTCLQPSEMHVTIVFSKGAFDETQVKPDENAINCRGGLRYVAAFGREVKDTAVLGFECAELSEDNAMYRAAGATSDFPDYRPHVTITLNIPPGLVVEDLKPYAGDLRFGPEIWADIKEDGNKGKVEKEEAGDDVGGGLGSTNRSLQKTRSHSQQLLAAKADLTHDDLKTNGGLLNAEQAGETGEVRRRKRRGLIEWIRRR